MQDTARNSRSPPRARHRSRDQRRDRHHHLVAERGAVTGARFDPTDSTATRSSRTDASDSCKKPSMVENMAPQARHGYRWRAGPRTGRRETGAGRQAGSSPRPGRPESPAVVEAGAIFMFYGGAGPLPGPAVPSARTGLHRHWRRRKSPYGRARQAPRRAYRRHLGSPACGRPCG